MLSIIGVGEMCNKSLEWQMSYHQHWKVHDGSPKQRDPEATKPWRERWAL